MTGTFRSDGLDNPCSPNSGGLTWSQVEAMADESPAVESYSLDGGNLTIKYVDGNASTFAEPVDAANEISAMSAT